MVTAKEQAPNKPEKECTEHKTYMGLTNTEFKSRLANNEITSYQYLEKRYQTKQTYIKFKGQNNWLQDRVENIMQGNIVYQQNKNL